MQFALSPQVGPAINANVGTASALSQLEASKLLAMSPSVQHGALPESQTNGVPASKQPAAGQGFSAGAQPNAPPGKPRGGKVLSKLTSLFKKASKAAHPNASSGSNLGGQAK